MIILLAVTMYTLVKNCIALITIMIIDDYNQQRTKFTWKLYPNPFQTTFYFYTSENISKPQGLCMFSGAQGMKQWLEMG